MGRFEDTEVGVPQGGPLSPICANIMLNELDHELERRGHKFVRYADDMVIFCRSRASAEQTLAHKDQPFPREAFSPYGRRDLDERRKGGGARFCGRYTQGSLIVCKKTPQTKKHSRQIRIVEKSGFAPREQLFTP